MKIRGVRSGKPKAQRSIAGRLTGAVLIPSVALLVMWLAVSAYLLYDGFYARAVASSVRQVSIPAVNGLASAQQERQLSMAYLGQPSIGTQQLHEQEKQTDDGLAAMKSAATAALANAPQAILTRFNVIAPALVRLAAQVRQGRPLDPAEVAPLLAEGLIPLYEHYIEDHTQRLRDACAPANLIDAFTRWREQLASPAG